MIPDQLRAAQDRAAAQAADRELTPEPGGAGGRVARADDEAALLKTRPDATRFGDEIAGLEMLAVALTHVATDEYE